MAGFPIRKSPDHSLFIDSPRHIADYNVLHRFLVPRHPPCALKNLRSQILDARVHCVILKQHATHQPTHHNHTEPSQVLTCSRSWPGCQCQPNPRTRMMHVLRTQQRANHTHHPISAGPFPTPSEDSVVLELARASSACTMIIVPPSTLPSHTR